VNKPMTTEEWLGWIQETWDAAQKAAWAEKPHGMRLVTPAPQPFEQGESSAVPAMPE